MNFILTWSADCVISIATAATKYAIPNTKLYVLVVTLSTQGNAKLFGFSRIKKTFFVISSELNILNSAYKILFSNGTNERLKCRD